MLSARSLRFSYKGGFTLGEIDLKVEAGSFWSLIGPNGSGKTTLLGLLSGSLVPQGGRVLFEGRPIQEIPRRELARRLAVISSDQYFEFPFSVREIVSMGRYPYLGRLLSFSREDHEIVSRALDLTGTAELAERPISEVSSGERQRVLIARAVAQQPRLLMLDEPNAHLDIHHQMAVFSLLERLNREEGVTLLMVLHDLTAAAAFSGRIALLDRGRLVRTGVPREVITPESIRQVYGEEVVVTANPVHGYPQVSFRRP